MFESNRFFHGLVSFAFVLMAVAIVLSADMRLSNAGLGCSEWPACYGRNLVEPAPAHAQWMNVLHRVAASVLGFVILLMTVLAWQRRRSAPKDFPLALALFGLTAFLAALGKWTPDPHLAIVALCNLLAGLSILALLWRLHLGYSRMPRTPSRLRIWVLPGLVLLALQITLGGMVSAKFAALTCAASLFSCDGWLQHASLAAFNPFQVLDAGPGNPFVPGAVQQTLQMAHRILALLVFGYLVWLGIRLLQENMRGAGTLVIALISLQAILGASAVIFSLPLVVVLMHNATAALLLLTLVTLNYKLRQQ